VIQKRASLGFQATADNTRQRLEDEVMAKVKQTFAPEFVNRLDEIIIFDELSDDDLVQIVDLQIAKLNKLIETRDLKIALTDDARKWLIDKTCGDRKYGARPLKRALQKYVEDELSEALIQGEVTEESTVEIYAAGERLAFREVRTAKAEKELTQKA
jgi:ATP-dependent Clp protease ATP-binding subunit ClpC